MSAPRKPLWEMVGELLREAGVLLIVFTILDTAGLRPWQVVLLELVGVTCLVAGVIVERSRKE